MNMLTDSKDAGFPYCYGVFREYFFTHDPFKGAAVVSTGGMLLNVSCCATFITRNMYLADLMSPRVPFKYIFPLSSTR